MVTDTRKYRALREPKAAGSSLLPIPSGCQELQGGEDAVSRKLWSLDVPDSPYPQHTSWLSRNLTQLPF